MNQWHGKFERRSWRSGIFNVLVFDIVRRSYVRIFAAGRPHTGMEHFEIVDDYELTHVVVKSESGGRASHVPTRDQDGQSGEKKKREEFHDLSPATHEQIFRRLCVGSSLVGASNGLPTTPNQYAKSKCKKYEKIEKADGVL